MSRKTISVEIREQDYSALCWNKMKGRTEGKPSTAKTETLSWKLIKYSINMLWLSHRERLSLYKMAAYVWRIKVSNWFACVHVWRAESTNNSTSNGKLCDATRRGVSDLYLNITEVLSVSEGCKETFTGILSRCFTENVSWVEPWSPVALETASLFLRIQINMLLYREP